MSEAPDLITLIDEAVATARAEGGDEREARHLARRSALAAYEGWHPQLLASMFYFGDRRGERDLRVFERAGIGVRVQRNEHYDRTWVTIDGCDSPHTSGALYHGLTVRVQMAQVPVYTELMSAIAWQLIRLREGGWEICFNAQKDALVSYLAVRAPGEEKNTLRIGPQLGYAKPGRRDRKRRERLAVIEAQLAAIPTLPPMGLSVIESAPVLGREILAEMADELAEIAQASADRMLVHRMIETNPDLDAEQALAMLPALRELGKA